MSMARTAALAALLLAASCASPVPPRPPPPPRPIAAAPAPPPPDGPRTLLGAPAPVAVPEVPPPAPVVGELPRRFEVVRLPPRVTTLFAVAGRGERDVWMLGEGREVLRWQGSRLDAVKMPACAFEVTLGPGYRVHSEPAYDTLAVLPGSVSVSGIRTDAGFRGSYPVFVEASSRDGRTFACHEGGDAALIRSMAGEAEIALMRAFSSARPLSVAGRGLPLPAGADQGEARVAGRAGADLWLWSRGGEGVWHHDGVGWQPRPLGRGKVAGLWVDEDGAAWVVGGGLAQRWDRQAGAWRILPLPADLDASHVAAASAREVWFFGKTTAFVWNGREVRRGELAVGEVRAAWVSPGGELWVVGEDRRARIRVKVEDGETEVPAGVALRAPAEVRP
jgi:hypothetical protein